MDLKITELVFSGKTLGVRSIDGENIFQSDITMIRRSGKKLIPLSKIRDYHNTKVLRIIDLATPNKILETPSYTKGIHRYLRAIQRLGLEEIDCMCFAGIVNNHPFNPKRRLFAYSAIPIGNKIPVGELKTGDVIYTKIKNTRKGNHYAIYLGNDYFLFKAGYRGGIQLTETSEMKICYPFDEVFICSPYEAHIPKFEEFLQQKTLSK